MAPLSGPPHLFSELVTDCDSPVAVSEFKKIALATLVGFLIMGLVGFFIKLIFIPINSAFIGA